MSETENSTQILEPSDYEFATDILALLNGLRPAADNANVYTPVKVVKQMLDILPKSLWARKDVKFLDPVCKSGVFLREITKRLVDAHIKDDGGDLRKIRGKDRLPYIQYVLANQIYGITTTEEAAKVSRRTIYGSQNALSKFSLSENLFNDAQGNIRYLECASNNNKIIYPFLEKSITDIFGEDMQFDVIIGNPPYQDEGGSGGNNDASIYQLFCEKSTALAPKFSSFIIPARWFAAGRENLIGNFRKYMLTSGRIKKLVTFADAGDCFPNIELKGGCCYYLEDRNYNGNCNYELIKAGKVDKLQRNLNEFDVLIREPLFAQIVRKVNQVRIHEGAGTVDSIISSDTPFGIPSNPRTSKKNPFEVSNAMQGAFNTQLFHIENNDRKVEYVKSTDITKNANDIAFDKVFIPGGYGAGESFPHQILGEPEIAPQNSVCSQSYLYAKFENSTHAKNFVSYLKTRFFRALVGAIKITQSAPNRVYRFVPLQDFSRPWTDEQLYEKYEITEEEQKFIESMIKPMV